MLFLQGGDGAMKKYTRPFISAYAVITAWALLPTTASAHHSFALYDRTIQYVFTGVVDSLNPDPAHLQINFVLLDAERKALARDAKGDRITWTVEMESAGVSAREGVSVGTYPRGTVFSVGLSPLRSGVRGGVRVGALYRCPEGKAPAAGKHCDSVTGAIKSENGELATATAIWIPAP